MPTYSASQGYNLWLPPPSFDPRDDEFDSGALTGWTLGTSSATAIDPYAGFAAGGFRYSTTYRQSWLMLQPQADAAYSVMLHKAVTLGTNDLVWCRINASRKAASASVTNNDGSIQLVLSASSAGAPDLNNRVSSGSDGATGAMNVSGSKIEAGVPTSVVSFAFDTNYNDIDLTAIQKIGTTYHFWYGNSVTGAWRWGGSTTYAGTLDRVSFIAANATTTTPGNLLVGIDFVRFLASATVLP